MDKLYTLIYVFSICVIFFSACDEYTPLGMQQDNLSIYEIVSNSFMSGNVYTNEYLGFSFEKPHGWYTTALDEPQIELGDIFLGHPPQSLYYMMAESANQDVRLEVEVDRLLFDEHDVMTGTEMILYMAEVVAGLGVQVHFDLNELTRIGNYDWNSLEIDMGHDYRARLFINVKDEILRSIIITVSGDYSINDILEKFVTVNSR